jgi:hypothetical protein
VSRALIALLLLVSSSAMAMPTRAQIDKLVAGFERFPTEAEVRELGADVDAALIAYAEDPTTSPHRALRAIAALRLAPSSRARAWLRAYVEREAKAATGHAALRVAAALGALTPYGADSGPLFVAQLAHDDVSIRHAAASALAQIRWPESRGALTTRIAVERDGAVAAALRKALRALADPESR